MRAGNVVLAIAVLLSLATAAQGSQRDGDARWWHDPAVAKQLGLTADQVSRIDRVFEDNLPGRRARQARLERLRAQFEKKLAEDDTAAAMALISPIVELEAEQNKHRVTLLLRMRQVLTADQRRLLQQLRPLRPVAPDRRR